MDYETIDKFLTPAVSGLFFLTIGACIVLSFILDYHWREYSTNSGAIWRMRVAYLVVSAILIGIMLITIPFLFS